MRGLPSRSALATLAMVFFPSVQGSSVGQHRVVHRQKILLPSVWGHPMRASRGRRCHSFLPRCIGVNHSPHRRRTGSLVLSWRTGRSRYAGVNRKDALRIPDRFRSSPLCGGLPRGDPSPDMLQPFFPATRGSSAPAGRGAAGPQVLPRYAGVIRTRFSKRAPY